MLFLVSLIATRLVTVRTSHRLGVATRLVIVAIMAALLAAQAAIPPVALGRLSSWFSPRSSTSSTS